MNIKNIMACFANRALTQALPPPSKKRQAPPPGRREKDVVRETESNRKSEDVTSGRSTQWVEAPQNEEQDGRYSLCSWFCLPQCLAPFNTVFSLSLFSIVGSLSPPARRWPQERRALPLVCSLVHTKCWGLSLVPSEHSMLADNLKLYHLN